MFFCPINTIRSRTVMFADLTAVIAIAVVLCIALFIAYIISWFFVDLTAVIFAIAVVLWTALFIAYITSWFVPCDSIWIARLFSCKSFISLIYHILLYILRLMFFCPINTIRSRTVIFVVLVVAIVAIAVVLWIALFIAYITSWFVPCDSIWIPRSFSCKSFISLIYHILLYIPQLMSLVRRESTFCIHAGDGRVLQAADDCGARFHRCYDACDQRRYRTAGYRY